MTLNRSDTAKFVPGAYDLIVLRDPTVYTHFHGQSNGDRRFLDADKPRFVDKGASVTTTANTADKNNLIDDTEDTGAQIATVAPIAGSSMTVDLAGSTPLTVRSVNVSAAAGPNNAGRFTAIRKFEIRTCNGTCANPLTDFTNVAFTSPDDAFPGDVPRPLQPNLNLRSFTLPTPTLATHVQLRVLSTQCTGQTKFAGDQDDDPFNNSDCPSSASGAIARGTEFEVFTSTATIAGTGAVSRKTHGTAGTFDIALPLTGTPGIECRTGGASGNHLVVITFAVPVTIGSASVTSGTGSVSSATISGNNVLVNLTGVANAQTIQITLFGVNNGTTTTNVVVPMSVLLGDTTANGSVNSSDISQTKAQSGTVASSSNFRTDVTVNGLINSSDISTVKSKSGTALP
jgi:hypothetical protein